MDRTCYDCEHQIVCKLHWDLTMVIREHIGMLNVDDRSISVANWPASIAPGCLLFKEREER